MQVIAVGKWSKAVRDWKMVVALRRPVASTSSPSVAKTALKQRPKDRPAK